jgi:hypothetical protein
MVRAPGRIVGGLGAIYFLVPFACLTTLLVILFRRMSTETRRAFPQCFSS